MRPFQDSLLFYDLINLLLEACPTCSPSSLHCNYTLPQATMAADLPDVAWPIPKCTTITQHQVNISALLNLSGLKPGHWEGAVQSQIKLRQIVMDFHTLAKHNPVNSKKYAAVLF